MLKTAFAAAIGRDEPLIIDGGLATQLEAQGCDLNNPLWSASLLLEQPDEIIAASRAFLDAGAECIATASYQASREGFGARGLTAKQADDLMESSVALARQARADFLAANPTVVFRPLIAASIGPYGAVLHDGSEYRGNYGLTDKELLAFHRDRLRLFDAGEADVLACETVPSVLEARVLAELLAGCKTPAWVSFSCCDGRHISDGTPIEDAVALFQGHSTVLAVGVNCTPPQFTVELIERIGRSLPDKAVIAYPNSGETWNAEQGRWSGSTMPLDYARAAQEWVEAGARIVGGCCRTGPEHITAITSAIR